MAEGKVVGYSEHPGCMSVATNSVAERLANASGAMFASMGPEFGIAEHGGGLPPSVSVISGKEFRTGKPYVNQIISALGGGGALYGYDGWLTLEQSVCMGTVTCDSVEIDEQKYPIMIKSRRITTDSGGNGRWRGAPARDSELLQRGNAGQWAYINDGHFNPPRGINGGMNARATDAWKYPVSDPSRMWAEDEDKRSRRIDLPQQGVVTVEADTEVMVSENPGGGGFGDPLERDPELVRWDAREEIISLETARDVYGVVIDTGPEQYAVDADATTQLRAEIRSERGGDGQ
jgi:N-methylhydantoinase B